MDRAPSFQESFLGEIPSIMLVTNDSVDHREYLGAILGYQLAEGFSISCLRSQDQL